MDSELIKSIILDALRDSFLVFTFVFLVHFILGAIEDNLTHFLLKRKKTAPLFGALFGLIPQCGTSVLGADLYIKRHISVGTLIAIFLSCSDEAFIVMLTNMNSNSVMILPLIGLKFAIGFVIGYLVDFIITKQKINKEYHEDHKCHQHHEENDGIHRFIVHPLLHSLEIFIYVLIINLALGFIIGAVGEENFASFLLSNRYLTPLYSSLIGLIPNCASSLLITELFMGGSLSFGALLAGLLVNSGLGMMILLKNKKTFKNVLVIIFVCFIVAVLSGYITCLISGF